MLGLIAVRTVFLLTVSASHAATTTSLNLLNYMNTHIQEISDLPAVAKYNRLKHFGSWVHQDYRNPCHDTREMVLERDGDKKVPLEYNKSGCSIKAGLWHDPYTGDDFRDADDLQIDHIVPLRAAYYAGAYDWPAPYRCNYANFIANDFHLQSVSGHENMSKGDRGPDHYLPPNRDNRCAYVSSWMKIKMIWELTATRDEVKAIRKVIADEGCADSYLSMDRGDLAAQRRAANAPIPSCADFGG